MKPSFLNREKPLKTVMIQVRSAHEAIETIRNTLCDGADAFGLQIEQLDHEYRTEQHLKNIFKTACDKPIYVTNYSNGLNKDMTTEARLDELLLAVKAGATLVDIPGDTFHPETEQMTFDAEAVQKQKDFIDKVHALGGEVLISSHIPTFKTENEVIAVAKAQIERGADFVKIVTFSNTEDELMQNLATTAKLKHEIDKPYLFLSSGRFNKLHRLIGPFLGCAVWLCVDRYDALATLAQPRLKAIKAIEDNFDYEPERE